MGPAGSILFLDEPTTGLDASTSMNVLRILKRLSLVGVFSLLLRKARSTADACACWAERADHCALHPPAPVQDLRCVPQHAAARRGLSDGGAGAAELFDSVTLLTDGHIVHHGAAPAALLLLRVPGMVADEDGARRRRRRRPLEQHRALLRFHRIQGAGPAPDAATSAVARLTWAAAVRAVQQPGRLRARRHHRRGGPRGTAPGGGAAGMCAGRG